MTNADLERRTTDVGHRAVATTAFPLIPLWYRSRAPVKKAFGLAEE
jgi:hypothetical protein